MNTFSRVLLLDENHLALSLCDKMEAHERALHHLAFSVYIFDERGQMLLQQRSPRKYHSGGLWSNACCSHPTDIPSVLETARLRLRQEMGFDSELRHLFSFGYRAAFDNGLTENEWDMVLAGRYSGAVEPNPDEVSAYRWVPADALERSVAASSEEYSAWFRESCGTVIQHLRAGRI